MARVPVMEWWFPLFVVAVRILIFYGIWTTLMTLAGEFQKYVDDNERSGLE